MESKDPASQKPISSNEKRIMNQIAQKTVAAEKRRVIDLGSTKNFSQMESKYSDSLIESDSIRDLIRYRFTIAENQDRIKWNSSILLKPHIDTLDPEFMER